MPITLTQDQAALFSVTFFDNHTPPRQAKIDVTDRQPVVTSPDPTKVSVSNIAVSADGLTLTFRADSGVVGDCGALSIDVDANLASGQDTSLVIPTDTFTIAPGAAGQAVSGNIAVNVIDKTVP